MLSKRAAGLVEATGGAGRATGGAGRATGRAGKLTGRPPAPVSVRRFLLPAQAFPSVILSAAKDPAPGASRVLPPFFR